MLSFFLNPLMLLGLAGVSLPVIAHLLSRRRYDVVEWGAMQFLNPSRRTKRRMRLEELLLLLIRMGAVGLLAFAAARPWINSGFLTGYRSAGSRDVVLVIDGSNSMSRSDGLTSLHQKAVRRAVEFLQSLRPGDTVGIIDARDRPIRITDSTLQNPEAVQQQLEEMSPPAGAADLKQACEEAVGMLGRCSNGAREIIVLTDRQRSGWSLSQDAAWQRFDDVMRFPSVRPKVWVIDVAAGLSPLNHNVSVGQLELSRDLTVPNFPVSLQIPVRNSGSESTNVPLQILVNGQRMADLDSTVSVAADSETVFSRSIRFQSEGTNLVTVRAEVPDDTVAADNESHAAVRVTSAIPALLVESSEDHDPRRANTFFASLALTAPQNKSPWINATTVHVRNLTAQDIRKAAVVVLPDVPGLSTESVQALLQFLNQGHGLWITLGKSTTADTFQKLYQDSGILPTIKLRRIRQASPGATSPTTIAPYSLEAAWLNRFRERDGASLT
ncbi:MAG: VWA domain-containing protein, partial [Planctomycetaceae bacterium]|nr:VWA domain-containing protein [Planctomycetaceae bacterium]